jgi:hypothetical protein
MQPSCRRRIAPRAIKNRTRFLGDSWKHPHLLTHVSPHANQLRRLASHKPALQHSNCLEAGRPVSKNCYVLVHSIFPPYQSFIFERKGFRKKFLTTGHTALESPSSVLVNFRYHIPFVLQFPPGIAAVMPSGYTVCMVTCRLSQR